MAAALDSLAGRPAARRRDLAGHVVGEDAARRHVSCAFAGKAGVHVDAVELGAWTRVRRFCGDRGDVQALESGVYRNSTPWTVKTPGGAELVVKAGTWIVLFALSEAAWSLYKAGDLDATGLLTLAQAEPTTRKEPSEMGRKKLEKQLAQLRKQADALTRNTGAVGSLSAVAHAERVAFGHLGDPFSAFDARVEAAERDLEKAKREGNEWAKTAARRELLEATNQRTHAKMMASEGARQRDVGLITRSMRGQGVPLLTNRHALPDDNRLREI